MSGSKYRRAFWATSDMHANRYTEYGYVTDDYNDEYDDSYDDDEEEGEDGHNDDQPPGETCNSSKDFCGNLEVICERSQIDRLNFGVANQHHRMR